MTARSSQPSIQSKLVFMLGYTLRDWGRLCANPDFIRAFDSDLGKAQIVAEHILETDLEPILVKMTFL